MSLNALHELKPAPAEALPVGSLRLLEHARQLASPSGEVPPGLHFTTVPQDLHAAQAGVRKLAEFRPGLWDEVGKIPYIQKLQEQLSKAFLKFIHDLFGHWPKSKPLPTASLPGWIRDYFSAFVTLLVVVLTLYVLYLVVGIIVQNRRMRVKTQRETPIVIDGTVLLDAAHHLRAARQLASEAQFGKGVRELYFAGLCTLEADGWVHLDQSRTNREYKAAVLKSVSSLSDTAVSSATAAKTSKFFFWHTAPEPLTLTTTPLSKQRTLEARRIVSETFGQMANFYEAGHYGARPLTENSFVECLTLFEALSREGSQHA